MGIELDNLDFIDALENAQLLGGGIVHIMGDNPRDGYVVHAGGRISLNGASYYETVKTLKSRNWMITRIDD